MTENSSHLEALENLCFVCGALLGKKSFNVTNYKSTVLQAFYIEIDSNVSVYPQKFCEKCYFKARNIIKRETTTNQLPIPKWKIHQLSDCFACETFTKLKKGGKKTKHVLRTGRPTKAFWDKEKTQTLMAKVKNDILLMPKSIFEFCPKINPQISFCLCNECNGVLRRPVVIRKCEHSFCMICFVRCIEGSYMNTLKCPRCQTNFTEDDVASSCTKKKLVESLRVACRKGCEAVFYISKNNERIDHERQCCGLKEKLSLIDLLEISHSLPLPKHAEIAAACVIKYKMANSLLPNKSIKIATGGPNVSSSTYILTYIHIYRL